MINNSTNINKMNNYFAPQISEHLKDNDICRRKSRSWLGNCDKNVRKWNFISNKQTIKKTLLRFASTQKDTHRHNMRVSAEGYSNNVLCALN